VAARRFRLAVANAVRAVRIDPSLHTWCRAAEIAGLAAARLPDKLWAAARQ
jgi:hypothetical protein